MSENERKPAPTAAEIAAAREFYTTSPARFVMPPVCLETGRVLIAALDAAEARATAAEKTLGSVISETADALGCDADNEVIVKCAEEFRDQQGELIAARSFAKIGIDETSAQAIRRLYAHVSDYESVWKRAETAERERDAARTALKPFAYYAEKRDAKPLGGLGDVIHAVHYGEDGAEITMQDCRAARDALRGTTPCSPAST